jgi:integrase/recombinase XerD
VRSGLRTIEVIRANYGDITFMGGERVLLVQGKGRDEKDNFIKLTPKTYAPIEEYLKTRKNLTESSPLFVSNSRNSMGQRLSTRTISKTAKESLIAIGLNERSFTAHSLRHTTAVNILRAGGSLELAQMTLRHSNPATTQIYTATLNEERRLKHSGEDLIETLY